MLFVCEGEVNASVDADADDLSGVMEHVGRPNPWKGDGLSMVQWK